jgi:hypothetical protein
MKKLNSLTLILGAISLLLLTQSCQEQVLTLQDRLAIETPLEIVNSGIPVEDLYGLEYEGGFIFHLNTTDGTGLVAATQNLANSNWGCEDTDIAGLPNVESSEANPETAVGARVGDGKANTESIMAECGESAKAAKSCVFYAGGDKNDWFLPSRKELALMYINLHLHGKGNFSTKDFYVSSTEYDENQVWVMAFDGGSRLALGKFFDHNGYHVRAVRSF